MNQDISLSLTARVALEEAGFRFTHSLGQNFLFDEELLTQIARCAGAYDGANVLEIGPGAGMLTGVMAREGANVLSIELDKSLEGVLSRTVGGCENVKIVFADAMKADVEALVNERFGDAPYVIAANLPYYITADFLMKAVCLARAPESITVLLQSEAAQRVLSRPGDENWCALAAVISFFCEGERLLEVPRGCFVPEPHVDSALVRFDRRRERVVKEEDTEPFVKFIKTAFALRRKTLVNNLTSAGIASREEAEAALTACGQDVRVRGEKLTLEEMAQVFYSLKGAE